MSQNVQNNSNFYICVGCLSGDRRLAIITDKQSLQYFHSFVDPFSMPEPLTLCWECCAVLQRSLKFRWQVKNAFQQFSMFMTNQNMKTIPSLSHLSRTMLTEYNYTFNEDVLGVSSKTEQQKIEVDVKIEDDYFDDGFGDEYDEKPIMEISMDKIDNFCDSDDEPLIAKKEKKNVKRKEKGIKVKKGKSAKQTSGVINNNRTKKKLQELNVEGRVEMVLLTWDEVESERAKILQSQLFQNYKYSCSACALGFSHRAKYDAHLTTKHNSSPGALQCSFCAVVCRDEKALSAHRRRHLVRWRCASCHALYSRCAVAADHAARHADTVTAVTAVTAVTVTHKCHKCDFIASTLSRLRQHASSHKERVKCELCSKTFAGKSALNTHMFIHKGEKEHACPKCEKKFLFKRTMEVHLMTHNAEQSFYCRECDMTFRNKMSFYQHKRYSLKHIDPARLKHTCELCGKSFAQAQRLREHSAAVHLKATPLACCEAGCSFACATRAVLRAHVRRAHRGARSRNHVCHLCGKTYGSKSLLSGHLNSHAGARPLRCARAHCGAAFAYPAALYNHTRLVHLRKNPKNPAPTAQWPVLTIANPEETRKHELTIP